MPFDLPPSGCPHCLGKIESATYGFKSSLTPQAGYLGVCLYCGGFLKLDKTRQAAKLTDGEFMVLPLEQQEDLIQARRNVIHMKPALKAAMKKAKQ
jgi:hypothetical protein